MNREYAQRCREKKREYLQDLVRKKDAEEAKLASLYPQVEIYRKHVEELQNQNNVLRQRLAQLELQALIDDGKISTKNFEVNYNLNMKSSEQKIIYKVIK
ncbi:hypothetical protein vseg_020505 [Gypsophila vaccaria]